MKFADDKTMTLLEIKIMKCSVAPSARGSTSETPETVRGVTRLDSTPRYRAAWNSFGHRKDSLHNVGLNLQD